MWLKFCESYRSYKLNWVTLEAGERREHGTDSLWVCGDEMAQTGWVMVTAGHCLYAVPQSHIETANFLFTFVYALKIKTSYERGLFKTYFF